MGLKAYKITEKTGSLVGLITIKEDDDILLITSDGIIIRMDTGEISTIGRNTQGVRLMKLANGVKVVSVTATEKSEEEDNQTEDGGDMNAENSEN